MDVTDEELAEGAIKFQVTTTVDGKTMYLTNDGELTETETTYTLGEDDTWAHEGGSLVWTKTFDKAPAGDYTVTETNSALKGSGYELVEGSGQPASATVKAGEEATA